MRWFILDFRLSQDTLYWHTGRFSFGTTVRVTEFTLLTPSKFAFCSPWTGGHANLKCFAKLGMIQFKSISLIAEFGSQDWAHVFVLNLLFLAWLYHSTFPVFLVYISFPLPSLRFIPSLSIHSVLRPPHTFLLHPSNYSLPNLPTFMFFSTHLLFLSSFFSLQITVRSGVVGSMRTNECRCGSWCFWCNWVL